MSEQMWIVRLWDGFDGEWMTVGEPMLEADAKKDAGDRNEKRSGSAAGKREGSYSDIDYYKAFPANSVMYFDGSTPERAMR